MSNATDSIRQKSEDLGTVANELADRLDALGARVSAVCDRAAESWLEAREAALELREDLEEPTSKIARAFDELAREARRSWERLRVGRAGPIR